MICFFFSSRRRHTRFDCDWSSDVCSSDLPLALGIGAGAELQRPLAIAVIGGLVMSTVAARGLVPAQIGKGSGRGRGWISGVGASFKKKKRRYSYRYMFIQLLTLYRRPVVC